MSFIKYNNEVDTFRVSFMDGRNPPIRVELAGICLLEPADLMNVIGIYDTPTELPEWLQKKLAVLMMCDIHQAFPGVETVGARLDENIFWVYRSSDDED